MHTVFNAVNRHLKEFPDKNIAVAVSGGADSMALCLALKACAGAHGVRLTALTVDHKLRDASNVEAQQVHQWLTAKNIHHRILTWQHSTISSRIQERARNARYQLLIDYCKQHEIQALFFGHHLHDQAETFMMRLSHQSGLRGLAGMAPESYIGDIRIIRPFLMLEPQILKEYLTSQAQPWINDPSNQMQVYERVRWRQQLPSLTALGLTPQVIWEVSQKLSLENEALEWAATDWIAHNAIWHNDLKWIDCTVDLKDLPEALVKRIMLQLVSKVRGVTLSMVDTRHNLNSPLQRLRAYPFAPFTFGGCYWMVKRDRLYIVREWEKAPTIDITSLNMTYDCRFQLKNAPIGKTMHAVGKQYWPWIKPYVTQTHLPYQVFLSLPIVPTAEGAFPLDVYQYL